jgi:hypothetical protein
MTSSSLPLGALRKDRVRIISTVTAKPGMTQEDFNKRWLQHGHLFRSMDYVQKNVIRYEQVPFILPHLFFCFLLLTIFSNLAAP